MLSLCRVRLRDLEMMGWPVELTGCNKGAFGFEGYFSA